MRKCYSCREEVEGTELLCDKCSLEEIRHLAGTLIIHDKI